MKIRTYSDLKMLDTFEDRFEYLRLGGSVGDETFGFDRHMNQAFYRSVEWKRARRLAILRDEGCDLGVDGFQIHGNLLVHHMNPMRPDDIIHGNLDIFDPEYLITTTDRTHNAIHYGDASLLPQPMVVRRPNDTKLW